MIDKELLDYTVDEIKKNINKPYIMNNNELATEILGELVFFFPDIKMVKVGNSEMFYITEKSKIRIIKMIEKKLADHKHKIGFLEKTLAELL